MASPYLRTLSVVALFCGASAHSDYPPGSVFPSEDACRSMDPNIPILSHHIHLFQNKGSRRWGNEVVQPQEPAEDILRGFQKALNITTECDSWIGYDARRCGFNIDGQASPDGSIGWYPVPALPDKNWAISVLPSDFAAAVHYITQHRCLPQEVTEPCPGDTLEKCISQCPVSDYEECVGKCSRGCNGYPAPLHEPICYDIFIHANTGCFINDHYQWGMWFGTPHYVFDAGFAPCLHGCGPTTNPGCIDGVLPVGPPEDLDGFLMCMFDENVIRNMLSCLQDPEQENQQCLAGVRACEEYVDFNLNLIMLPICLNRCEEGDVGCQLDCIQSNVNLEIEFDPYIDECRADCDAGPDEGRAQCHIRCFAENAIGLFLPCDPTGGSCCSEDVVRQPGGPLPGGWPDGDCELSPKPGNVLCDGREDTWERIMEYAENKPNEMDAL